MNKPQELVELAPERILDLDVRGDLRAGRDPFTRIMHARHALAEDGVLRLRAIFEPRPLYTVLGREGFQAWTEQLADDDWRVWFYRPEGGEGTGASASASPAAEGSASPSLPVVTTPPASDPAPRRPDGGRRLPTCGTPHPEPADIHLLDVRGLEPPEPMTRTLAALEDLEEGHTLAQVNDRVPRFLLPELDTRGFQYTVREEDDVVRVFIRHREERPVLDVRLLPPREKHPTIFETFDALAPGESFTIVNDHDPRPLKYQFQGERPDAFTWRYLAEGPEIWRVEIGRSA